MQVAIYYHFLTGIYVSRNGRLDRIERLLLTQGLAQIRVWVYCTVLPRNTSDSVPEKVFGIRSHSPPSGGRGESCSMYRCCVAAVCGMLKPFEAYELSDVTIRQSCDAH